MKNFIFIYLLLEMENEEMVLIYGKILFKKQRSIEQIREIYNHHIEEYTSFEDLIE